ncbi:MAG: hypothetical protein OXG37_03690 [Actinomycetia bacterium]|nr:hypothetical protein [Actinomycetes bacterium]
MIKNEPVETCQEDGRNLYRLQQQLPGLEQPEEPWPVEDGGILAEGQSPAPQPEQPRPME